MLDSDSELLLQERFDQLRADGQLCPCNCADCPLREAAEAIDAEGVSVTAHKPHITFSSQVESR